MSFGGFQKAKVPLAGNLLTDGERISN